MEAFDIFLNSRKLPLLRYLEETTLTNIPVRNFQPSFANIAALRSVVFLMPSIPSYLDRQILSTSY